MVEELTPKSIRKQPFVLRYYIYMVAVAVLFAVFYIVGALVPFEPFVFYDWGGVPTVKCPGEPVDTSFISKVKAGPYTIRGFTQGEGYWVDKDGIPYGGTPIDPEGVPLSPTKRNQLQV